MIKCFVCNGIHTNINYLNCDKIITIMIENYKNKNYDKIENIINIKNIKKSTHKKYTCEHCEKTLSVLHCIFEELTLVCFYPNQDKEPIL